MRSPTRFDEPRGSSLNGVMFSARRRAGLGDYVFGLAIGASAALSVLLAVALTLGLAWVIVVIVQDLGRRLASG
jgi:hypothetical protein